MKFNVKDSWNVYRPRLWCYDAGFETLWKRAGVCWNQVHHSHLWWPISGPPVNQKDSYIVYTPDVTPSEKVSRLYVWTARGHIFPVPQEFLYIQHNQSLTKRRFKPREDVSTFRGTSLILNEPVQACHVENAYFRVKVMLSQLSLLHFWDHTINE